MTLTLDEIRELILDRYDPYTIIDMLDMTTEELLGDFDEVLEKHYDDLNKMFSEEGY